VSDWQKGREGHLRHSRRHRRHRVRPAHRCPGRGPRPEAAPPMTTVRDDHWVISLSWYSSKRSSKIRIYTARSQLMSVQRQASERDEAEKAWPLSHLCCVAVGRPRLAAAAQAALSTLPDVRAAGLQHAADCSASILAAHGRVSWPAVCVSICEESGAAMLTVLALSAMR